MDYLTRKTQFVLGLGMTLVICLAPWQASAQFQRRDTTRTDSLRYRPLYLPSFRLPDRHGDPFSNYTTQSPLYLKDPKSLKQEILPDTGRTYSVFERMGGMNFRPPTYLTFDEVNQFHLQSIQKDYWRSRSRALDGESAVSSRNLLPKLYVSPTLDRIFGGSYVELIPRGFVTLDFGGQWQKIQNPAIPIRQQTNGGFEFDQQINLAVTGKVGEKLKITTNFDNNNSFDFQNQMKVEYTGFKEDILKKLEIGNVSLPLNNSLITGAQNLFGVKAQMQFGKMFVTAIATTQRGKQSTLDVSGSTGGATQGRPFEIVGSNYDENRNFFLGQFFRDNFENWLSTLPQITSGINVTRIEVYLLNRQNDTQTLRDVVGLMDLGETDKAYRKNYYTIGVPDGSPTANSNNNLYQLVSALPPNSDGINQALEGLFGGQPFVNGTDFEKITSARKLAPTEFTYQKELGYITLQRKLQNDEALAVAFEYTYNGRVYKVGELTEDYSNKGEKDVVYLKLLRPRKVAVKDDFGKILPTWNLMMKNIYNLNVTQLQREGFQLRVIYRDDRTGIDNPQLQDGDYSKTKQLIEVFGLDRLNPYNDPQPDGNFDYVEKITINSETGMIIFPYLEPFNKGLRNLFAKESNANTQQLLIQKYVYDTLYHTTKAEAELVATKNKFYIVGSFKAGAGKDIIIQGFNISQGSVKVFAGGSPLREGTDYTVDYTFGKVTILNEGILTSGKNISVTYEQQDPFAFQTRSLLGTRLDYKLNNDVNLGGTFLYYNERPLISRNLIGTEPARNMQYGIDFNMKKNSRILTKMVDALPFLQTKEQSSVTVNAEFAQLLPGTSNVINGEGTSFIDDFENTATPYSLLNPVGWKLAVVPQTTDNRFDLSGGQIDDVRAGFRRAKLAWYQIDNLFYREQSTYKPPNISSKDLENHYVRPVLPQEIFPFRDPYVGNFYEQIFDMAYYPSERGPYNFNPDLNTDGTLKNPKKNWAGITSAVRSEVDFDKANIEYVEFWLLDPFINNANGVINDGVNEPKPNTTGGKLIIHLGSISEDLMRDGKHAFENGLPGDGNLAGGGATENNWGFVTTQQYLNNAFNTDATSRINQDVGLDGVGNSKELTKFGDFINQVNGSAKPIVQEDPSADDFKYFLGPQLDAKDAKILERYKNINGVEANSPILTGNEPYALSGSNIPENEDLNQDNTLSDLEEYYGFSIDLKPGGLEVGKKYIVDKIVPDGKPDVTWYLFRIPIRQYEEKVGGINGFKSIRYSRMILTEFSQPVVLRFANFRAVGNRWRRYTATLAQSQFNEQLEPNLDNFSVSVVNVEENGKGNNEKPAYVPPLARDRDVTSTVQRRLNEQSVQMCVTNLEDGDGRSIYKNVSFDFFNYGRIKMFLSAHGNGLKDNQLTGFLRLGTDFDQNYYEIELPLVITPSGNNPNPDVVWPEANQIDLDLNELYALKAARDRESYPLGQLYPLAGPKQVGKHGIRIFGRPDMSQVKLMMIGVRNPRSPDSKSLSVCIWADEMRLTDFDRTAGWAANAVLNAKLADLGNLTTSFKKITYGYGGVQSKISERARGETTVFDISANIAVEKLLPRNTGLKIPMFISYENTTVNPNFDPANPDMRLEAAYKSFNTDAEREAYRKLIQDVAIRRSLNFTNVRKTKVRTDAPSNLYDIENFSFTYAYSEATRTNFNLQENTQRSIKGAVAWQFNPKFSGFEPFKGTPWKSPWLQLIKDFNFNPVPTAISVRGELDRSFNKIVYRNSVNNSSTNQANIQKYFVFNRFYTARWGLSKNLSLDYNARVNAIIDEPDVDPGGGYSAILGRYVSAEEYKDSVMTNLKSWGRKKNFDQTITANYTVPFDKIPLTNWIGTEYRYNTNYSWRAGPVERTDSLKFGNTIQNAQDQGLNGRLDLVKLYNKIGYLKEINTPKRPLTPTEKAKAKADTVKRPPDNFLLKSALRILMSIRNITATYNVTQGTILPGFLPSPALLGMDATWSAPGWAFILGSQDPSIRFKARDNNWLSKSSKITAPFTQTSSKDLGIRTALELSQDFKIQLDVKKTTTSTFQEIYRFDEGIGDYAELSPSRTGSYRISTISIGTAFANNTSLTSDVFKTFEQNIGIIQNRFGSTGYEKKSQDVLIPAFLSAYTGSSPQTMSLTPFPSTPLPNWRLDYSGLMKFAFFKDNFQSVTISHAYSSTYSVASFTNSLEYSDVTNTKSLSDYNSTYFADKVNSQGQLIPVYVISQVLISEQFAPLVGINVRTKNKLTGRFEWKRKRDVSLNVSNAQITEMTSEDYSFELGYIKNNLRLPIKSQGRVITMKNDVNFRLNVSVTNNQTIQRKIEEVNTITNGNINIQVRPNISYAVNNKLNIQIYVDSNINDPLVTNSYRRATTRVGTKILFNLAQ